MMDQNNKNDNNGDSPTTSSFSKKLHSSLSKMSCCFRRKNRRHPAESGGGSFVHVNSTGRLLRSSTAWVRSRAHDRLPEIKDKCRRLIYEIGGGRRRSHRRYSADFRYDALSYSRNFDEGGIGEDGGNGAEFRFRSFSARLPQSPPRDDDDGDDDAGSTSDFTPTTTMTTAAAAATTEIVNANGR